MGQFPGILLGRHTSMLGSCSGAAGRDALVTPKAALSGWGDQLGERLPEWACRIPEGIMLSPRKDPGAVANDVGIDCGAFSGGVKVSAQATRSMGGSVGFSASVGQPSTFRMVIWPEASSAQNSMAAVSAEGRTVWVLIRRLNSSCKRSIAFVV